MNSLNDAEEHRHGSSQTSRAVRDRCASMSQEQSNNSDSNQVLSRSGFGLEGSRLLDATAAFVDFGAALALAAAATGVFALMGKHCCRVGARSKARRTATPKQDDRLTLSPSVALSVTQPQPTSRWDRPFEHTGGRLN